MPNSSSSRGRPVRKSSAAPTERKSQTPGGKERKLRDSDPTAIVPIDQLQALRKKSRRAGDIVIPDNPAPSLSDIEVEIVFEEDVEEAPPEEAGGTNEEGGTSEEGAGEPAATDDAEET